MPTITFKPKTSADSAETRLIAANVVRRVADSSRARLESRCNFCRVSCEASRKQLSPNMQNAKIQHLVPMQQRLFDAIKAGKVDEVREMVKQNPALKDARDASGASAILLAAYNMKPDVVMALLDAGATVDIFEAAVLGQVDRIREILKQTPARASEYAPDGFTPVALAAFFGQPAAVKALIAAGADVNAAAKNGLKVAALHAAVAGGKLDIVKAVLEAGADPNAQQQAGFRPIHEAGTKANRALAELLLKHGADPTLTSDDGKSAIDLAREKGHAEFAEWLATNRPAG